MYVYTCVYTYMYTLGAYHMHIYFYTYIYTHIKAKHMCVYRKNIKHVFSLPLRLMLKGPTLQGPSAATVCTVCTVRTNRIHSIYLNKCMCLTKPIISENNSFTTNTHRTVDWAKSIC